jgi:hypothetical protein
VTFVASDSNLGRSLGDIFERRGGVTWSWCEGESFAGERRMGVRSVAG